MRTSTTQDNDFIQLVAKSISDDLLEDAIAHIAAEFSPEDVFGSDVLIDWAEDKGAENVFSHETLTEWAKNNGFEEKQ